MLRISLSVPDKPLQPHWNDKDAASSIPVSAKRPMDHTNTHTHRTVMRAPIPWTILPSDNADQHVSHFFKDNNDHYPYGSNQVKVPL
jgi:hypothetical protein